MSEAGEVLSPSTVAATSQQRGLIKWAPGQSGNPAGRSKRFAAVTAAAQDKGMEALEKLGVLMNCGDERVELMAATAILDRAFGKPKEQKADDAQAGKPDLSRLSPDDLAALRRVMVVLAGQSQPVTDDDAAPAAQAIAA